MYIYIGSQYLEKKLWSRSFNRFRCDFKWERYEFKRACWRLNDGIKSRITVSLLQPLSIRCHWCTKDTLWSEFIVRRVSLSENVEYFLTRYRYYYTVLLLLLLLVYNCIVYCYVFRNVIWISIWIVIKFFFSLRCFVNKHRRSKVTRCLAINAIAGDLSRVECSMNRSVEKIFSVHDFSSISWNFRPRISSPPLPLPLEGRVERRELR